MATEDLGPADRGIDPGRSPQQLIRWLMASILLGRNVRQTIVKQGYEALVAAGYTSPAEFERHGHAEVVRVRDAAHYTRYDDLMTDELHTVLVGVAHDYGSVQQLVTTAEDRGEAERRLVGYKGVGPTTARIFLNAVPGRLQGTERT